MSSAAMSLHRPHPSTFTSLRRAMLFVLFTHALAVATATATDGSGGAGAVYSVWEATDPCSAPMDVNGCRSSVDCNTCLTRPGCAIESTTAKCVSASRINASVGIEYFITGTANYCDASDDACTACGVTSKSNQAVCRGAHGCICVRQCEITPLEVIKCNSDNQANNMLYLVIACTVVAPLLVFVRLHRKFSGSLTRYLVPVRRPRQPKENPLALKLDGWRNHLEHEAKDQPTTIELKRCSLHSDSDNASSMEEGRHTEDCDAFSPMGSQSHIEDAYVVVTTPKASSAQPARGV